MRKDGTRTRSTTVHLPIDLAKRLAIHCAETGTRQSEIVVAALAEYLR